MTTKPNDNRAPIRLSASLIGRVAAVAERDGVSVTATVRRLVEQALGLVEASAITLASNEVVVWWLTEDDCHALGEPGIVDTMDLPDYIKREYSSRYGRAGRGRLWGLPSSIDPWPDTPLSRIAERAGGIVFHRRDIDAVFLLPGMVTDLWLNRVAP